MLYDERCFPLEVELPSRVSLIVGVDLVFTAYMLLW